MPYPPTDSRWARSGSGLLGIVGTIIAGVSPLCANTYIYHLGWLIVGADGAGLLGFQFGAYPGCRARHGVLLNPMAVFVTNRLHAEHTIVLSAWRCSDPEQVVASVDPCRGKDPIHVTHVVVR